MLAPGTVSSLANWRQRFQILLLSPWLPSALYLYLRTEFPWNTPRILIPSQPAGPPSCQDLSQAPCPHPHTGWKLPKEKGPSLARMWGFVGWGGCGECGWIRSLLPGCAATEGGVGWMEGVQRWGEEGVGSFSLQGSPSFHRIVWHAFPEKLPGTTLHLTNLILFLSSSWFLPKMEKACLKPFGTTLRFPAFRLVLYKHSTQCVLGL